MRTPYSRSARLAVAAVSIILSTGACSLAQSDTAFSFDADVRLFTAHAFANIGGYDLEFRSEGMHPIRDSVRSILLERLPESYRDSISAFYVGHAHYLGYYGTYAFALAPPPSLGLAFDSAASSPWTAGRIRALEGLDARLAEFYRRAGIDSLWQRFEPAIQREHDRFRPYAAAALDSLESYLRSRPPELEGDGRIVTAFSPLLSHFQAFTITVNGDVYLGFGPQPTEPSAASYFHEAAHLFVDAVVEQHRSEAARLEPLFELSRSKEGTFGYSELEESLVRALDIVLSQRLFGSSHDEAWERVQTEYRHGFTLCPYFYDKLREFERSDESLAAFFPTMLSDIDVGAERQRWHDFWGAESGD